MSYELKHSAEEIDYKLELIDKNKNLLTYPYKYKTQGQKLPDGLEEVGDGSFLTNKAVESSDDAEITLNFIVTPGDPKTDTYYSIYFKIADAVSGDDYGIDFVKDSGFRLKMTYDDQKDPYSFYASKWIKLDAGVEELRWTVSLIVPKKFDAGLLIKPQIEKGDTVTDWSPHMDKIGLYVDRRFNGTNTKIKLLNEQKCQCQIIDWSENN